MSAVNHGRRKTATGTRNAFIEQQFDRLQAAIRSIGDLFTGQPARRAIEMSKTLIAIADPGVERVAVNPQAKGHGWHIRLFEAIAPAGMPKDAENQKAFIRETHPLRRTLFGPTETFEQYLLGDPERERRRKAHNRGSTKNEYHDPCMFTLMLGLERAARAAEKAREAGVRQTIKACRTLAKDAVRRERQRAVELRRMAANIGDAGRRSREQTDADRRRRGERVMARVGASTAIAGIDARLNDLQQRLVPFEQPVQQAAYNALVSLRATWRTTASLRHDRAEKEATHLGGVATAARSRADALRHHRETIAGSWSGAANPGGAIGYLARLKQTGSEDPRVVMAIQQSLRRAHGAQVSASCAERHDRQGRAEGAATQGMDDQAVAGADQRPLHERVRPVEHRVDARKRWREQKQVEGTAEPMKYDSMPGVEEVGGATRRKAERLNTLTLKRMFSVATTAMTDQLWWKTMKRDGEIKVTRTDGGDGAALIYAPEGLDLTSPRKTAESFLLNAPKPQVCMPRMVDGVRKRGRIDHRMAHVVFSMPKTAFPDEMVSDQAVLGAAFARLRIMGCDPRRHMCLAFRHDDHLSADKQGCIHVHVMVDRVRNDGRVWDVGGMDMVAAANAASNLMGSLFLRKQRDPSCMEPMFGAPLAREGKDGSGRGARIAAMQALEKLAKGHMRCQLKWQEPDQPDGGIGYNAPMHGHDEDGTKDPERIICGKTAIRDALVLAGHSGVLPGFMKIDDVGRDSLMDTLEHETTTRNPNTNTPWRFLDAEERAVRMWEHLFRVLAERCG